MQEEGRRKYFRRQKDGGLAHIGVHKSLDVDVCVDVDEGGTEHRKREEEGSALALRGG